MEVCYRGCIPVQLRQAENLAGNVLQKTITYVLHNHQGLRYVWTRMEPFSSSYEKARPRAGRTPVASFSRPGFCAPSGLCFSLSASREAFLSTEYIIPRRCSDGKDVSVPQPHERERPACEPVRQTG